MWRSLWTKVDQIATQQTATDARNDERHQNTVKRLDDSERTVQRLSDKTESLDNRVTALEAVKRT